LKVLILRFSAFGDVALLVPVIYAALKLNPSLQLTLLTKSPLVKLFPEHARLEVIGIDFKTSYKGIFGIWTLSSEIRKKRYDHIVDLHDVVRTRLLSFFLNISGHKVIRFVKGRKEKEQRVNSKVKSHSPLKHTTERYADPLRSLGLEVRVEKSHIPVYTDGAEEIQSIFKSVDQSAVLIGVAPFAKHASKTLPTDKLVKMLKRVEEKHANCCFVFFGGKEERPKLDNLASNFKVSLNVSGMLNPAAEINLMGRLDWIVTMDSANMHLGVLSGSRVISIWGGTHPCIGFGPLFNEAFIIQAELPCRPCTVYGKVDSKAQVDCYTAAFRNLEENNLADLIILNP
jgi:ADP-heptose:LPS heptosyltransferase